MNNDQKKLFWRVMRRFQQEGVHNHVILIGSWVEVVYAEAAVLSGFQATSRTFDLDILVRNRYPHIRTPINVPEILGNLGFSPQHDQIDEGMKFEFYESGVALYIEFLVANRGKGLDNPAKIEALGVKAESLRNIALLVENTINVTVDEITITVPTPSAYVLQKNDHQR